MDTQDAVKKLKNAGGSYNRLSAGEIYDIFRALQGSFAYSDELSGLTTYVEGNNAAFANNAPLQDKVLSDIKVNPENLEEFDNMYQAVSLFSSNKPIRNKFATEAYKVIENYSILNVYSPDELDVVEGIARNLKKDIDDGIIAVKANEKKAVEKFIKKIEAEINAFVKENDLGNVSAFSAADLDKSLSLVESVNAQLETATGAYAQNNKEIEDFLNSVEIVQDPKDTDGDKLTSAQFRQEVYDLATEDALRKCALDPAFAAKPLHEQKLALIEAKKEAVEEFIRKSMLSEAVHDAERKFTSGKITAKDKKEFEKKAAKAFEDFKKGKTKKIQINKNVALMNLATSKQRVLAVGKYIAKKTGFTKFYDRAKAGWKKFEEEHPKTAKVAKGFGKAALKGAAVLAAAKLFTPAGALVSAGFATHAAIKSWRDMKNKYKSDPAYKNKKFGAYLKDHKMDVIVAGATALSAGVAGVVGLGGLAAAAGGVSMDAVVRRMVRGGASLTVGLSSGTRSLVNATSSKERRAAWGMMAISGGIAAVSMFLGDDIAKFAQEKLGLGGAGGAGKGAGTGAEDVNDAAKVETQVPDGKLESGDDRPFWKRWLGIGEDKAGTEAGDGVKAGETAETAEAAAAETETTTVVDYDKDYARDFDPETAKGVQTGAYRRSLEYTRSYMQTMEVRNGTGVRITNEMAKAMLDEKIENLKLFSPELIAAAASRGISAEEIYNLAHMEKMQFHPDTYLRSYSQTITLENGREYTITSSSMADIAKGNCAGLSVEDQLKIIDHARSHYDLEHGGKVTATPSVKGDEWRPLPIKAGALFNRCGEDDFIAAERTAEATRKIVETTTTITTDTDDYSNIDVSEGEAVTDPIEKVVEEEEPVVIIAEEKIPAAEAPKAPEQTLHEVIGDPGNNFTTESISQGFIPSESGLQFVGEEEASAYLDRMIDKYAAYGRQMIDDEWAVRFSNVHMTTGDDVMKAFTEGINTGDAFVVRGANGSPEWYVAGGGETHEALAAKYPKQFGESFNNYRKALDNFSEAENAPVVNGETTRVSTVSVNDMRNARVNTK
ncbi:MAG: hypothetical protein LBR70_05760 [Lactobacillaceae bacterium]|nr:hypothetical protein [Lactobacillaceae bacterium]